MITQVEHVFGVSSKPVASYIERVEVDNRFVDALRSDKQLVVYGASKQGKTALVSRHLPYEKNIKVNVSPKTELTDIYKSILRQLGIQLRVNETTNSGREFGVGISARFRALIPLFGDGEAAAEGSAKTTHEKAQEYEEIPFNLELPQDIAEIVHKVRDSIVVILENFHYLIDEKQQQFAFDLRTFQELGVQFVILGVWREKNRR